MAQMETDTDPELAVVDLGPVPEKPCDPDDDDYKLVCYEVETCDRCSSPGVSKFFDDDVGAARAYFALMEVSEEHISVALRARYRNSNGEERTVYLDTKRYEGKKKGLCALV